MVSPVPAAAIANEFLKIQEENPGATPIDNMKMQKLIFYAHAWHLAIFEDPLIENDIEAWSWGPVVRDVYLSFIDFGRNPIVGAKALRVRVTADAPPRAEYYSPEIGGDNEQLQ